MGRLEFIGEVIEKKYYDGKTKKYYNCMYIRVPKEVRDLLKPGTKVKVVIEPV